MATSLGTAKQGMSAAIVLQAISLIEGMITDAQELLHDKVEPAITGVINAVAQTPAQAGASYDASHAAVAQRIADIDLNAQSPQFPTLPPLIEDAVSTFFADYLGKMDELFPGLSQAGGAAQDWATHVLQAASGVTYQEDVDASKPQTVFELARLEAFAQERQVLDAAAAAGHRFAPGMAHNAMARIHAQSLRTVSEAQVAAHLDRVQEERAAKLQLVRALLAQRMDRIKQVHQQAVQAFQAKLRARGLWMGDQDAVVDAFNKRQVLGTQFQARLAQLMQLAARRLHTSTADALQAGDLSVELAKLRMSNGQEVVDMLGNMITTLNNQIRAHGSYSGSERDVTDWDALLS